MKTGTYVAEIGASMTVSIPEELVRKVGLHPGDKVEILLKKIQPGKKIILTTDDSLLDILRIGKDEA